MRGVDPFAPDYVELDAADLAKAQSAGARRHGSAEARGYAHRAALASGDDPAANHVLGAAGEIAFAKWYGVQSFDPTVNTYKSGGDVLNFQVRTRRQPAGDAFLIVREGDRDHDIFVLVVAVKDNLFRMCGWSYGWAAKLDSWKRDPGNRGAAFFVPEWNLQPMSTIPREPSGE